MADADEVAHQQGHRGPPTPARRALLQGSLRVEQTPLLHDLPVEQQEPGQSVPADEPELLLQPVRHPLGHGAVAPPGGLKAEPPQVAIGGVAPGHGRLGQGVAQAGGQVELALLRNPAGVCNGLRVAAEDFLHPVRGLQAQVVVGLDEGQGLRDGDVALRCYQRVLEPAAVPGVVVNVVGGGQGDARAQGQRRQFPVAGGVALQEILLEFHVHPAGAVPFPAGPEQPAGVLGAALQQQLGPGPVPAPGEQHHPPGVFGQASRVQPSTVST